MTELIRVQLQRRREALGLSQRDVADQMGTSQSHVSELETGTTNPNLPTLERWAYTLGFEVRIVERTTASILLLLLGGRLRQRNKA
jgi:transcriptional regulator with XRE-family HTH domain